MVNTHGVSAPLWLSIYVKYSEGVKISFHTTAILWDSLVCAWWLESARIWMMLDFLEQRSLGCNKNSAKFPSAHRVSVSVGHQHKASLNPKTKQKKSLRGVLDSTGSSLNPSFKQTFPCLQRTSKTALGPPHCWDKKNPKTHTKTLKD